MLVVFLFRRVYIGYKDRVFFRILVWLLLGDIFFFCRLCSFCVIFIYLVFFKDLGVLSCLGSSLSFVDFRRLFM